MQAGTATDTILAARRRFFDEGCLPEGLVATPILRSWQRCASRGLAVDRAPRVEPMASGELRALHERHERLLRLARPEIEALRGDAEWTDSVVILTDAAGLVLDVAGSAAFADRASRVALRPGVPWSEAETGTNAIGTALVERRPIAVHGAEHFFEPHRILACAAAPIVDPRGALAGVLDMSGHAAVRHLHALGLVRLAVEQIEHRFFDHGFEHCTILRFHRDGELVGTAREGVLVFEEERLVAANRHGLGLMGLDWSALDEVTLPGLLRRSTPRGEVGPLQGRRGETFLGRLVGPARRTRRGGGGPAAARHKVEPILTGEVRQALSEAVRLLEADVPVLVQGETGTGKEVFARQVHALSVRAERPFVAVNCAALPEGLIESELFGYEAGAFTGARREGHKGLLRQADGGVLFLDEIGDMPLSLQSRLLRVLQDKEISPLGGGRPVPVDFALVCATHRPLSDLVATGGFRQDLYFRIAQYVVTLQPLRSHPDRIRLVRDLWRQLAGEEAGTPLSREAERLLAAYNWPGNFRQLVGSLRALIVLAERGRPVEAAALPADIRSAATGTPAEPEAAARPVDRIDRPLAEHTREAMLAALEASGGNVSHAARRLGIDRTTIYRRLLWDKRRRA
ncbi:sigma-54-dependent Fis family transcriptional regulator [Chelatococcus sp. SYSU_G07232]|uniref:Sigma-54-dependent Fis family transcriptional regulator n=1 Tax=Chelatococcus albus TaxID=3047466 RepID=A0ABT7AL21_9HYPH|nr:sigma-54-dependent Fis family transcriptional regulator [Chelatococcus sp. SYSU_G07232]MDJ1160081.1 sigma-54-dependent Fis family transcriptional regulator [Chelatococcus sp. SYSU_G07232]